MKTLLAKLRSDSQNYSQMIFSPREVLMCGQELDLDEHYCMKERP